MLKQLRLKFVCINMVMVTIMLCVILGMVVQSTRADLENQSLSAMREAAEGLFQPGRPGELSAETRLPSFTLQMTPWGEVTATGGGYYDLSDKDYLMEVLEQALAQEEQSGVLREYGLRYYRADVPMGQKVVFADISGETDTINGLIRSCVLIGAAAFLLFLIISLFLARWAVKPVDRAWEQQRQFVADASHELKTPLTVIMTNAELLDSPDCPEENRARFADSILAMSRQMRGLVESLLELARIDNGADGTVLSQVELSRVAEEAVLPFDAVFFEQGLTLDTDVETGITVKGSESHLRQVEEILLDNARKYSLPNARVTLSLRRTGRSQCLLSVSNEGEAISKEDLKNIFKRFYRVDKARSMNQSYGLGLSIAQRIVEDHGGRIWAESRDGVNTFFVQLPTI